MRERVPCCDRWPDLAVRPRRNRARQGRILFVPQRPYLPLGTLASALLYPRGDKCGVSTARLAAVLAEVGLGALADELDMIENWSQRLSLGEQQRFAFARILLVAPALLFLPSSRR